METEKKPAASNPLKLGIFYSKRDDAIHKDKSYEYTFEVGTKDELEKSPWNRSALGLEPVDVFRLPLKIRGTLLRFYEEHKKKHDPYDTHPFCGAIEYRAFDTGKKRIGYASTYYPKDYMNKTGLATAAFTRKRTGLGTMLELLSLEHFIQAENITHVSTFDGVEKEVKKSGSPKEINRLPAVSNYYALRSRMLQLTRRGLNPLKVHPVKTWMERLMQKKLDTRRPAHFATSRSRRSI